MSSHKRKEKKRKEKKRKEKKRKEKKKEKKRKEKKRKERNRSPSTIARTGPFCQSRAWKPLTPMRLVNNSNRIKIAAHRRSTNYYTMEELFSFWQYSLFQQHQDAAVALWCKWRLAGRQTRVATLTTDICFTAEMLANFLDRGVLT